MPIRMETSDALVLCSGEPSSGGSGSAPCGTPMKSMVTSSSVDGISDADRTTILQDRPSARDEMAQDV